MTGSLGSHADALAFRDPGVARRKQRVAVIRLAGPQGIVSSTGRRPFRPADHLFDKLLPFPGIATDEVRKTRLCPDLSMGLIGEKRAELTHYEPGSDQEQRGWPLSVPTATGEAPPLDALNEAIRPRERRQKKKVSSPIRPWTKCAPSARP